MIKLINEGTYLVKGKMTKDLQADKNQARKGTMAYQIMNKHNISKDEKKMNIEFDCLMSHDITYVGIIQTARASGLKEFPLPYAMTNCHNSLCAVGGTINEDDHVFGLSAAKKYGGIYVPVNQAVIHQYAREAMSKCGSMILGSDSHTRYGALGTMGVGEGGPELVKQLLHNTYDVDAPEVVLVWVTGKVPHGVGPHDIAVSLVKAVFENGFVKNKIMEFAGPGIKNLPIDFRNGIDVMTTETTCLSSIWMTDDEVKKYYVNHGRPEDYAEIKPMDGAYYDSVIELDLSKAECMIALPFHPSNAYSIQEFKANARDILNELDKSAVEQFGKKVHFDLSEKYVDGKMLADQGIIAGCAGGLFDNLCQAANILDGASTGNGYFGLSCYPASMPVYMAMTKTGIAEKLLEAGAIIKPCFCGPCFGAGDVPANNGFSIRHATRNFPNREGSKPGQGQISSVALMDARSIAATARMEGVLTAASEIDYDDSYIEYEFDKSIYDKRIYNGYKKADPEAELKLGPNITDWPKMYPMQKNMLLELCAVIHDPVTTTDELIPSGETSSYRSNPLKLSEFALSRRVPEYVGLSKAVQALDRARREGKIDAKLTDALAKIGKADEINDTAFGSCLFANKPGDGSAREQAASCQKVLGGDANICYEYATKRYRSNCINWGIVPFTIDKETEFDYESGDMVFVPNAREAVEKSIENIPAKVISKKGVFDIMLHVKGLTEDEKTILLEGCLMNYYAAQNNKK
ncbi:MAG: hydratase [Clostridia bacterium]|nr:hydratase [Clostridia bacterium]